MIVAVKINNTTKKEKNSKKMLKDKNMLKKMFNEGKR